MYENEKQRDQKVIERIKSQLADNHCVFKRESELITPRKAAEGSPYTPNEVGMLVKLGLVTGRKMGRTTLVDRESFERLVSFRSSVPKLGILWDD